MARINRNLILYGLSPLNNKDSITQITRFPSCLVPQGLIAHQALAIINRLFRHVLAIYDCHINGENPKLIQKRSCVVFIWYLDIFFFWGSMK